MFVASIGDQVDHAFSVFFAWLPHLVGALVVLVIGYFVAKLVGGLVGKALRRAGFDRTLHSGQFGASIQRVVSSPSRVVGTITFWALWLGAISLAVSVLGVESLKNFVAAVYAYLPNVLAAVLIFLVASAIAGFVATFANRVLAGTSLGKIVGTVAPILVMAIAGFMILNQLQIAPAIVTITYAAIMGAIALGTALAFGLGGRDVAAQMLQGAYEKGQANTEQWKRDLDQGTQRARGEVESARTSAPTPAVTPVQPAPRGPQV